MLRRTGSIILAAVLAAGCSSSPTKTDSSTVTADAGVADSAVSDVGSTADLGPKADSKPKADARPVADFGTPPPVALETVVNTLIVPSSSPDVQKYGLDLDGNGTKDNAVGAIFATIGGLVTELDPKTIIDAKLKDGTMIMLFRVLADALNASPKAAVYSFQGKDQDGNAADNYSGSEEFLIDPVTASNPMLRGSISASKLDVGPSTMKIPLPISKGAPPIVEVRLARIEGKVSATGIVDGVIGGAIPKSEITAKVLPAVASIIDDVYKNSKDANTKSQLGSMFDTNNDKTIDANEFSTNPLVTTFFVPDIDTDGDNTPDAISIGLGFTAVTCKIK
ncbi:MAG: hypothetical protein IT371_10155 [Deltaproteobacteria bacterium]|nr:hypothetical protein [Deltaproteobacteria bacterium]